MDTEKGEHLPKVAQEQPSKLKRFATLLKLVMGSILITALLAVMFGMGVLGARYVNDAAHHDDVVAMNRVAQKGADERVHEISGRDVDCVESTVSAASSADAIMVSAPQVSSFFSGTTGIAGVSGDLGDGISIPITTIYSVQMPEVTTLTQTKTSVVTVPAPPVSTSVSILFSTFETLTEVCSVQVITKTASYTVTVTPPSSPLGDATVTGIPATVTNVHTDVSVSSRLPDATVSGKPPTVTNVQTDFSVTSGLPDATVSGNPPTVTNVETEISVTGLPDATVSGSPPIVTDVRTEISVTGLPDATVSGRPPTLTKIQTGISVTGSSSSPIVVTVSDLFPQSPRPMSTVTAYATISLTVTKGRSSWVVITVSDLYPPTATSAADGAVGTPTSTFTKVVTKTSGSTSVSTRTIQVPAPSPPYPSANGTVPSRPSGTITTIPSPTTPVIISGGAKKPEPRGWGGSNGSSNLGCAMMLIAAIMFLM